MRDGHRALFIIPLILLIVLVIMFRVELLVTGLRLVGVVHKSYRAERYVADYYRNNAMLSQDLANTMYMDVLNGLQKRIQTESGDQKAKDAMALGRLYECGKGVPVDLGKAQQWYQVAVDSNTDKEDTRYQVDLQRVKSSGGMATASSGSAAASKGKSGTTGTMNAGSTNTGNGNAGYAVSGVCSFRNSQWR